jgi:hypothetical protein
MCWMISTNSAKNYEKYSGQKNALFFICRMLKIIGFLVKIILRCVLLIL